MAATVKSTAALRLFQLGLRPALRSPVRPYRVGHRVSTILEVRSPRHFSNQIRLRAEVSAPTAAAPSAQATPQIPPSPARSSYILRILKFLAIAAAALTAGFAMTAYPALRTANEVLTPPTDEESLTLFNPTSSDPAYAINEFILNHPLCKELQQDPDFIASRPHLKIPASLRQHNFTAGTLMGGEKLAIPPLVFSTPDGTKFVSFQYLGPALCGHPGIVHGGLLATLLDEGLARCCFNALPNRVGVTASLKVDYRSPCYAGQFVVLRAETTKVEGRKAWVKGRLESLPAFDPLTGTTATKAEVFAEAEALFIEPRQAATMAKIYSSSEPVKKVSNGEHQTQPARVAS